MMNNVNLTGRLTKEPELHYSQSGTPIVNFTIAVNRPYTNDKGERDADFFQVVGFNGTAESVANYLNKGSLIAVEGRLQSRTYEREDGSTVWVTEVVANNVHFMESKSDVEAREKNNKRNYGKNNQRRK